MDNLPPMDEQEWICDDIGYNTCVKFEVVEENWMDAKAKCQYQEGDLVKIYDEGYLNWVITGCTKLVLQCIRPN